MKYRLLPLLAVSLLVAPLSSASSPARRVVDRPGCGEPCGEIVAGRANVQVEIVVDGRPATVYRDGGYRWIEGRRGESFSFRVTNRNSFPVGVIPSADGQSLTADGRAGAANPAYVVDAYGSMTISVWREDLKGGRELVFTDVDRSLAARKGDRRNVGVLGVLVWELQDRERPPVISRDDRAKGEGGRPGAARKSAPSSSASEDSAGIGVGAGDRVSDPAFLTSRYRRVRVLDTVAIYYDDRDGLLRAGVDLGQYRKQPDRRGSEPFPNGGYQGVKIPR